MKNRFVDVAVIGAGSAGLTAFRAAKAETKHVVLIEGAHYGTTCARVGCMPSKLLIAAAEANHQVAMAEQFGIVTAPAKVDGYAVMDRVRRERDRFVGFVVESTQAIPEEQRLIGNAHFLDDHRLQVGDHTIVTAKRIVIATGSTPSYPKSFESLEDRLIVNDDVFSWKTLPNRVAVFGPGVIGLELGQALNRLGVEVHMFGLGGLLGPLSDPEVLKTAHREFEKEFYLDTDAQVKRMEKSDEQVEIDFIDKNGQPKHITVDYVLAATGRRPNVDGLKLTNTRLPLDEKGIPVFDSETLRIGNSHVFIAGDVTNDRPLLHEAADEGRIAGENAGRYPTVTPGLRRTPLGIVFSDPQIAMVGKRYVDLDLNNVLIGEVSFEDQGRSRVMLQNKGLLRVYADKRTGCFLGAEMLGPRAEHIGHLLAWAHQSGLRIHEMLEMPFYHPVIEEGLRTALRDVQSKLAQVSQKAA